MSDAILITGASGFVGSHLVEKLLRDGHTLKALALDFEQPAWLALPQEIRSNIELVEGDIVEAKTAKEAIKGCGYCFHLAALMPSHTQAWSSHAFIETNVSGTLNLLHASLAKDTKVVHISDAQVYGAGLYAPIGETHPLLGQGPYAASKIASDMLAESFVTSFGLETTILRPFHLYGAYQAQDALIPGLIKSIKAKEPLLDPYSCRDLCYIEDFLRACKMSLSNPFKGQVFNIGSGEIVSNQEIAEVLASQLEIPLQIEQNQFQAPRKVHPSLNAGLDKINQTFNWEPQYSLQAGLSDLLKKQA